MIFNWLDTGDAAKVGAALADQFAPSRGKQSSPAAAGDALSEILLRADPEVRQLRLNFYKKAKFANAFKWRLLENGVDKALADEVTHRLVVHLSGNQAVPASSLKPETVATDRPPSKDAKSLLARANKHIAHGAYADAVALYQTQCSPADRVQQSGSGTFASRAL